MNDAQPKTLIGGKFVSRTDRDPIDVYNPCTGELLWSQPRCGQEHVSEALHHAREVLKSWSAIHGWERGRILRSVAGELRDKRNEIANALSLEVGRPISQSPGEVDAAIEQFEWFAGEAQRLFGDSIASRQGGRLITESEPVGICAAFTAWNFPVNLPARKIAPALAAGCPIILRPSEQAPMTSTLIAEACVAGGVPPGVLQMLFGYPEDISPAIMEAEEVRKISLTGSTRVGKLVLAQAAETIKRCSMELGGHSPVVVCADSDVEKAATQCAAFKFRNAGQVCIAPNRFYVEESVANQFTDVLVAEAEKLVLGDSLNTKTTMGPLTLASGREKVERLISDAIDKGAELKTGGNRPDGRNAGFFLEPTVLADVPANADIMLEEPFGPVAAISSFSNLEEAVIEANSTPFGLAAYAFTGDHRTAEQLSKRLHAGMVGINTFMVAHAEAPFGGVDHSGMGREGGREAIKDYQNTKLTHMIWA